MKYFTNIFNYINNKNLKVHIIYLFAIFLGIGMFCHEMWRDELEIFLLKKHHGFIELNDPSYVIYYSLIKLFLLLKPSLVSFQLFHFLIILSAVSIFVIYCPVNNIEKILFIFSYFILYEYGIISRWYGFLILLIFLIMLLISKQKRNYLLITVLLLVLANHTGVSAVFAVSLSLYLILDIYNKIKSKELIFKNNLNLQISSVVFIIGWIGIFLIYYVFILKISKSMGDSFVSSPVFLTIKNIWNSYIPIPYLKEKVCFWSSNIIPFKMVYFPTDNLNIFYTFWHIFAFAVSILIILVLCIKFSEKIIVLITFLFTLILYFIFIQYLKIYVIRYQGIFFLIFIYCYWLYYITDKEINIKYLKGVNEFFKKKAFVYMQKSFKPLLYIILIAQVFSAFYAFSKDAKYKFTFSREVAEYIKLNNIHNTHIMVGYPDWAAQCIVAYTDKQIFYPQYNKFEYSHNEIRKKLNFSTDIPVVMNACINFTEKQNKKVLLILNFPLTDNKGSFLSEAMLSPNSKIRLLQSFTGEIIEQDEQYWIYEVYKIN